MDLAEYAVEFAWITGEMRKNRKAYDELDHRHMRSVESGVLLAAGAKATAQAEWARLDREYDLHRDDHKTLIERGPDL
jgi:hypothetical protein